MVISARSALRLIALLLLAPVLAVVIVATLLLLGVEPRLVFLPGFFFKSRLEAFGFHVHNRIGVVTTVVLWWVLIVSVWLALRRLLQGKTRPQRLFSYGSLQQTDVQLATFGRLLQGQRDELPGFEPSLVRIEDPQVVAGSGKTHYANVIANGRNDSRVSGTVFEIDEAELAAADEYERHAAYKRVAVTLASGKQAWVYVDARSAVR